MALSLESVIRRCFESLNTSYFSNCSSRKNNDCTHKYMTVPLVGDSFFVPSFVIRSLNKNTVNTPLIDTVAVNLYHGGAYAYYKSLAPNIREILKTDYSQSRLISFSVFPDDTFPKQYYATYGALFDENYNPLMMIGWNLKKSHSDDREKPIVFDFVSPVLWVSKDVFGDSKNPVKRFIVNKIIPAALSYAVVYSPTVGKNFRCCNTSFATKMIVSRCPFVVKSANSPSVSTTNRELLDVALGNLDDVI